MSSISLLRWGFKKAARMGIVLISLFSGHVDFRRKVSAASRVRVLTYHRFGSVSRDPFCLSLKDFEAQMAWLASQKRAISLIDLERFLRGEQDLPNGSVLVTIDDGYSSVYWGALPILRKYGIPCVLFLTVGAIQEIAQEIDLITEEPEPHLTWPEVQVLNQAGCTIASHGWTHRSLGNISLAEVEEEAIHSRQILEKHLQEPMGAFAYPFGTQADFNESTAKILSESGYQFVFTSQHGAVQQSLDSLMLPRIKVESGEPLWMFKWLAQGGLDGWQLIDKTLWQFQQTPSAGLLKRS
jgi:peptidoglycan/xylan/chitin deacetylase (PgdA/CDA1 family)